MTWAQVSTPKTQDPAVKGFLVHTVVYDGDTIPYAVLPAVTCVTPRVFATYKQYQAWDRLKYNVKKVYPYAILAAAKLKEYDRVLATIPRECDRNAYMRATEKQLKNEFGPELTNLSVTQGRILIKLIDRETGKTTYDVVKSMRGSFSAMMWQGVALMFNSSLKADYDADGDEKGIEIAIKMIEDGQL
ncbi:MAG: DUF4294 domain-containing protein [Bacteroidia bacterium]